MASFRVLIRRGVELGQHDRQVGRFQFGVRTTLVASILLLGWALLVWRWPLPLLALALPLGVLWFVTRPVPPPDPLRVARQLDEQHGLADLMATAVEFGPRARDAAVIEALTRDADRRAERVRMSPPRKRMEAIDLALLVLYLLLWMWLLYHGLQT